MKRRKGFFVFGSNFKSWLHTHGASAVLDDNVERKIPIKESDYYALTVTAVGSSGLNSRKNTKICS